MYIRKFAILSATILLLSAARSYPADTAHGLDLAKRWCASCHLVSPEQQRASTDVPPFAVIAKSLARATPEDAANGVEPFGRG